MTNVKLGGRVRRRHWLALATIVATLAGVGLVSPAASAQPISSPQPAAAIRAAAAAACSIAQSGAAVPAQSSGRNAVRTTIGVAKSMGVPIKGQIIAVMVMYQESSIRNLANDGTTTHSSWPTPGKDYWLSVTRLSLKYPHDKFGVREGAHDTDSIGLYQQRPAYGWGNYGDSNGTNDPEGVVQRLLDPRWEAMAFFGGSRTAAPKGGLLDVAGWQTMEPTVAADTVQQSNHPDYYAQWEILATSFVNDNQDAPAIDLPWIPGGGRGALSCTSIPSDPASGEAGRNPLGSLDTATIVGNTIRVSGWAFDPDAINGLGQIHFYDQGPFGVTGYGNGLANQLREDVNRAYNVVGKFGYVNVLPWTGPGLHTICAYGINVGRGSGNPQLGCRSLVIPGPMGSLDTARLSASGNIDIVGWAADPAAPGARTQVHAYVTGPAGIAGTPGIFTGDSRPDVARALPWAGGTQGFHATVRSMGEGDNKVCLWAINVAPPNNNPAIGCRTVAVRTYPFGYLDAVSVSGNKAKVTGWTVDPASPSSSIQVHIYVTSASGRTAGNPFVANDPRADVNAVTGVAGRHGYSRQVTLFAGLNTVCAYGIGTISGHNTTLGCRTVTANGPAAAVAVAPGASQERAAQPPAAVSPTDVVPPASSGRPTSVVPPTSSVPTVAVPTVAVPTVAVPTTAVPTTAVPTTAVPTTAPEQRASAAAAGTPSVPPTAAAPAARPEPASQRPADEP